MWKPLTILILLSPLGLTAADYLEQIKPVFKERCTACHGALKQKAGLRLDTAAYLLAGSREHRVLDPGQVDGSILLARLTSHDPDERMPPEGKPLEPKTIAAIRAWIAAGAPAPEDERAEDDPRAHWAFQPIVSPTVTGTGNPVDVLLEVQRVALGTKAQPAALRSIQLRRLYLDLIGLPPTREELKDTRPWETIVDELLARPTYGERWARHWMDIWRYSDWYGLGKQLRYSQKHLWHWRDWIVESLNEDKGYDRMITEMLAGDELAPLDPQVVRATGFLARNYYLFNRTTWLDSTIEHTGKAFVGLTFNCAKCHDHKYDPISQQEYYQLRAIFEPHQVRLDPVPGETDFEKGGLPRVFDDHLDVLTHVHIRGDEKNPDTTLKVVPGVPAILAGFAPAIQAIDLPYEAYVPGARTMVQDAHLAAAKKHVETSRVALTEAEKTLEDGLRVVETPDVAPHADFALVEPFEQLNTNRWEMMGEGWTFEGGVLHQKVVSRDPAKLRSIDEHPRDFDLTCRYTHTGGATYKSVSFRFDTSADGGEANMVYTSAHAPGPKLQVAHVTKGQTDYPKSGRVNRPIVVGETVTLRLAVRDTVLNVWLNEEFLLAYRLPRRMPGHLELSAFDATASFDHLELHALASDVVLVEPKEGSPVPDDAVQALERARLALKHAQAGELALQAVIEADRARVTGREGADALAHAAVCAQADVLVVESETKLAAARPDQRKGAEQALADAKAAREALGEDAVAYAPLRASVKALETPAHKASDYPAVYPATSTGRRTALAGWISSRENPLTARVAVNHVWMRHFGEPLVDSVFDFGRRAKQPVQVDLLDFLAASFMASDWSFKELHRLILTSESYRMSSSNREADAATRAADPENRGYWRMNPRRMEAQVIRDSLLQLAGQLDLKVGGPPVDPTQVSTRRSLYFRQSRDAKQPFIEAFNNADILQCYRRSESIVPQQALALANSKTSIVHASAIAGQLKDSDWVGEAFEKVLARAPLEAERQACSAYLESLSAVQSDAAVLRARLVHVLINHNDFVTIR
ncbi:MAG: hypothetical protein ACI9TH_004424 [Kiritimatiellia bacterium]|jgi:hypothetical protein